MADFLRAIQAVRPTVTAEDSELSSRDVTSSIEAFIWLLLLFHLFFPPTVVKHIEFTNEAGVEWGDQSSSRAFVFSVVSLSLSSF